MTMAWARSWLPVLCATIGASATIAAVLVGVSQRQGGPRALVTPERLELLAPADKVKARGTFFIQNLGGADLVLGQPSTTCTCTVVAIEPTTVPPGGTSEVTVEGRAPAAGRTRVVISIPVNLEPGQLDLQLDLVGRAAPPYIADHLTAIRYGVVSEPGAAERVFIETRERADAPHWLLDPESTDQAVAVRGGFVWEDDMGDGVVRRRYEYDARLVGLPGDGEFQAEVRFPGPKTGDLPALVIPVHGIVRKGPGERLFDPGPRRGP